MTSGHCDSLCVLISLPPIWFHSSFITDITHFLHEIASVLITSVQFSSIAQSCPTLCSPMNCSTSCLPVHHQRPEFTQIHVHRVSDVIHHLILCHLLLLLPSVFPSIRVFSNESTLCIRWPKYWSFSFSISPFNEYSGLLSFSIDRLFSIGLLFQTRWPCSPCAHCFVCSG